MALKACKECGGQVSTQADACPHCGAKAPTKSDGLARVAVGVLSVVIVGSIIAAFASYNSTGTSSSSSTPAPSVAVPPEKSEGDVLAEIAAAKTAGDHGAVINWAGVFLRRFPNSPSAASVMADQQAASDARAAADAEAIAARRWGYEDTEDAMTGAVTSIARSDSVNEFMLQSPYEGVQRGRLVLRRHPRHGVDVMVSILRGQIQCDRYTNTHFNVRFDDEQPRRYECSEPASRESTVIFVVNQQDFIRRLKAADRVRVELQLFRQGAVVLEFDSSRFDEEKWPHG